MFFSQELLNKIPRGEEYPSKWNKRESVNCAKKERPDESLGEYSG